MAKRVVAFEFVEIDGTVNLVGVRCDETETDPVPVPPSKAMIGAVVPITIKPSLLPPHLLLCDGTQYLREDYPDLYALLDTPFIVDADHFITPDLRGITVIGAGLYNPGAVTYAVNDLVGARQHTLLATEMPSHTHTQNQHGHTTQNHNHGINNHTHTLNDPGHGHGMSNHNHNILARASSTPGTAAQLMRGSATGTDSNINTAAANPTATASITTGITVDSVALSTNVANVSVDPTTATNQNTGGGQPHNNMQPSRALNYALVAKAG